MENKKTLSEKIFLELSKIFDPLRNMTNENQIFYLFNQIGYDISDAAEFVNTFTIIADALPDLDFIAAIKQNDNTMEKIEQIASLIISIKDSVDNIFEIKTKFQEKYSDISLNDFEDKIKIIPKKLLDYLITYYLQNNNPKIFRSLQLFGIIEEEDNNLTTIPEFNDSEKIITTYNICWDRIPKIFNSPLDLLNKCYDWKEDLEFNHAKFFKNLELWFKTLYISGGLYNRDENVYNKFLPIEEEFDDSENIESKYELRIPIESGGMWPQSYWEFGISISHIPAETDPVKPKGISIIPYFVGELSNSQNEEDGYLPILNIQNDFINLILKFKTGLDINNGLGLIIRPRHEIELLNNLFNENTLEKLSDFGIQITLKQPENKELYLFGTPGSTYFGIKGASLKLIVEKEASGSLQFGWEIAVREAKLVISGEEGDSFISKILPKDPFIMKFAVTLGMDINRGFYISGAAGFEYIFHINKSMGPIYIETVGLSLALSEEGIGLETALSARANLGPLKVAVKKIGLRTALDFTKKGLLGNADFNLGFKPPSALGLSIDAGMVKGGGFLEIDDGNYYGVLALSIKEKISLTVIAILITRTEEDEKMFSLKMIGMAEFPPIQLGFGFSISGVGLAIAINCRMNIEALRNATYNGSLRSLLFPPDPAANAMQIIRDLKDFMPPCDDSYVIGAMVKIGWGAGDPIVHADAGIFIELGNTFRIALAGIAYAILPNENSPILFLKIQILGVIDFDNKTMAIDASLTGSKLLKFHLDGDLALRSSWGDNPRFGLSIGGFYPGFKPPSDFPVMRRLSLSLGSGNPRIGLFCYMAITENSFQFGANLLFHWEKKLKVIGLLEIDGEIGFDVLFIFNPFHFETQLYAGFCLKRNGKVILGIDLRLFLEGPNNYHAVGTAFFKILCFEIDVDFDVAWGDKEDELIGYSNPGELLLAELNNHKNWYLEDEASYIPAIIYRNGEDIETLSDHYGFICFNQKSVPLQFEMEKFGKTKIEGTKNFDVIHDQNDEIVEGFFAPGEYENLSESEKISAPPFEKHKSGLKFKEVEFELSKNNDQLIYEEREMEYEVIMINEDDNQNREAFHLGRFDVKTKKSFLNRQRNVGRTKYTNGSYFMHKIEKDKICSVKEQQIIIAKDTFNAETGFQIDDGLTGLNYSEMTYSKMRNKLKKRKNKVRENIMAYEKVF